MCNFKTNNSCVTFHYLLSHVTNVCTKESFMSSFRETPFDLGCVSGYQPRSDDQLGDPFNGLGKALDS